MATLDTIANAAARPGSPSDGDMYYQIDTQSVILYDGTATEWKAYKPDAAPYTIGVDGSGDDIIMDTTPLFHFDADKFNGTDDTGNPADDATVDGTWVSRTNGVAATDIGTYQPVYKTGGANGEPYLYFASDLMKMEVDSVIPAQVGAYTLFGFLNMASSGNISFGGSISDNIKTGFETLWFSGGTSNYCYYNKVAGSETNPLIDSVAADYSVVGEGRMFILTRNAANLTSLFVDGANTNADLDGDGFDGTYFQFSSIGQSIGSAWNSKSTGDFYELAFWNSELSTTEKNKLVTYVNTRYDIGRDGAGTGTFARVAFS